MNFENVNFLKNPHFQFREIISDKVEGYSVSSLFDIFIDNNGETILAVPYFDINNPRSMEFDISLISLKDNQEKKKLEGHIARFKVIKYFYNENNGGKYLVSVDKKSKVIIWDINDNYSKMIEIIIIQYKAYINDILMVFINKEIYLITASLSETELTKVINFNFENINKDKIKETSDIVDSQGFRKLCLCHWFNKQKNKNYIIQTGNTKILISEIPNLNTYSIIKTNEDYHNISSLVYEKNGKDLLLIVSNFGLITIYDLINKNNVKEIKIEYSFLINVLKWNEKLFITIDCNRKNILLIDSNINKIINAVKINEIFSHERYLRKVRHPIYGEALISIGNDYKIKLFIDKNYNKEIKIEL